MVWSLRRRGMQRRARGRRDLTEESAEPEGEPPDPAQRTAALELVWRCLRCGELWVRQEQPPESCPNCGAPPEELVLVTED
jgi:rubrerythrin